MKWIKKAAAASRRTPLPRSRESNRFPGRRRAMAGMHGRPPRRRPAAGMPGNTSRPPAPAAHFPPLRARKQKPARQASGDRTGTLRAGPRSPGAPRKDGAADANRLRQRAWPRWMPGANGACARGPRRQTPGAPQGVPAHDMETGRRSAAIGLQRRSRQGQGQRPARAPKAKPRLQGRNPPGHAERRCAPAAAPRAAG